MKFSKFKRTYQDGRDSKINRNSSSIRIFCLNACLRLIKEQKEKGKQMNRFFMMALIILSSNTYANTSYQFPFPFSSIKQDPEFAWTNEIWGKLKEVKITENGTDLAVLIGYENQLIKMSVKSKLDKNHYRRRTDYY
jgi:hypothetical protein